jgi:hypothetical protein
MQKLEEMLHSSQIVAGGFYGDDRRALEEIIDSDVAAVTALGLTVGQIAERMKDITRKAAAGLGMWVDLPDGKRALVDEAKGSLICPWPDDEFTCRKRVTTLEETASGKTVLWTDLSIHLIEQHGFFEGKGSPFRIEPDHLVELLFKAG